MKDSFTLKNPWQKILEFPVSCSPVHSSGSNFIILWAASVQFSTFKQIKSMQELLKGPVLYHQISCTEGNQMKLELRDVYIEKGPCKYCYIFKLYVF